MGYQHSFLGVNLKELQQLFGSKNEQFLSEFSTAMASELEDLDAFFESEIEDGTCPDSMRAAQDIIAGTIAFPEQDAMYGYVLKVICEHIGEYLEGGDVYDVDEHTHESQLAGTGPPIPIPYDNGDFPQIGFIQSSDVAEEIRRLRAAPRTRKLSLKERAIKKLSGGLAGPRMGDEEMCEDMDEYLEVLQDAQRKGYSIVSFRH